jgi:hypothetical protein
LKIGDELYSIQHGHLIVTELREEGNGTQYLIICADIDKQKRVFTKDGKSSITHYGPVLFTSNPFEYAISQIKKHQQVSLSVTNQNVELWKRITTLEANQKKTEDA